MLITIDPLLRRRLQARTRLIVEVFDGESYGHDYGSYGHKEGDTIWWYDDRVYTGDPMRFHDHILDDWDEALDVTDFIRGRYSPVNETISLIPALTDDYCSVDYDIPREVFEALEAEFPDASTVEVF